MNFEQAPEQPDLRTPRLSQKHTNRLTIIGIVLTLAGIGLFAYFVYSVGVGEIVNNISRFGIDGFAIILAFYFLRICMRSAAWTLVSLRAVLPENERRDPGRDHRRGDEQHDPAGYFGQWHDEGGRGSQTDPARRRAFIRCN